MPEKIPFANALSTGGERQYIEESIASGQLAGNGYFTKQCQAWLEEHLNTPCARLVTSCTAGLEMSALLSEIEPGDEVIMPSFTFVSTANAFLLFGAVPVFIDIRPDTLNIDETLIESAITTHTKAIVPVHYAGVGCEMDTIMALAAKHNLFVIEDAAQGIGSRYKQHALGTMGDFASISFHQTKNITSGGEGGALLVNNHSKIERTDIVLEKGTNRKQFFQGIVDKYTWVDIGSSFVMSDLLAAYLLAQLERLEVINADRMNQWQSFHNAFKNLEDQGKVRRPIIPDECEHNAHIYYLLLNTEEERNACLAKLNGEGINAVFHYIPLHSSPSGQLYGRVASSMKVTDDLSRRLLRLPIWAGLPQQQHNRIISEVKAYFE